VRDAAGLPVHVRLAIANWPEDPGHGAVAAFCGEHGISRSWFYRLRARAVAEGALAVASPRSRRPSTSPSRIDAGVEDLALLVRADLLADGWDGGPISVRQAMLERGLPAPSRSSLARIFARHGVAVSNPRKRPKATRRFTYPAPNQCWQLDGFDHALADGTIVCVLQVIDDHSRRILASRAATGETSTDVQAVLATAIGRVGVPQRFLSDNGAALNPTRRGRRGLVETWLRSQGTQPITSTPGHPRTQGKSERHHQTSQRWLAARPAAEDRPALQALLETFEDAYNQRPHQGLGMLTPLQTWAATPVAPPPPRPHPTAACDHPRDGAVIARSTDSRGVFNLDHYKINLGVRHGDATVLTTTDGPDIHIWDRDGLFLRTVTLQPDRRYYGTGRPTRKTPRTTQLSGMS
jgi:putative transposase